MKRNGFLRFLSLLLCLTTVLAFVAPSAGNTTRVSAAVPTGIQSVTFDETNVMTEILENVDLGDTAPTAPSQITDKGGNKAFSPAVGDSTYSNITTVKEDKLGDTPLKSVSFQVKFENFKHKGNGGAFYALYDASSVSAAGISFSFWQEVNDGPVMLLIRKASYGAGITTDLQNTTGANLNRSSFAAAQTLNITVNYDYSRISDGIIQIWYDISADAVPGVWDAKTVRIPATGMAAYTVTGLDASLPLKTLKPAIANSVSGGSNEYYDDLKFVYDTDSSLTKVNAWYIANSDILSKTNITYNPVTDDAAWQAAFDGYDAMDDAGKQILFDNGVLQKLLDMKDVANSPAVLAYMQTHEYALSLTESTATPADSDALNAAIADYKALNSVYKACLMTQYNTLLDVQYYLLGYVAPRADEYDTSPMLFDFNYKQNYFLNLDPDDPKLVNELVQDPLSKKENGVWHLQGYYSSDFLLDDAHWASYTMPDTVSLKVYFQGEPNAFARPAIYLSYFDEENYSVIRFAGNIAWTDKVVDGVLVSSRIWNESAMDAKFDMTSGWSTVTIKYLETSANVTVVDANDNTVTASVSFIPGGKFGFKMHGSYDIQRGSHTYIDDINMTFKVGDFDVNDEVGKINVYYTGNTFLKPNETLFVSGEKLGTTVDKVYLMRLDDLTNPALGYIAASGWDSDGLDFYDAVYAKDPATQWNQQNAVELDILQRSDLSLNMLIPGDVEPGIYVLKLTAKVPGYDDAYVYVNAPVVTFASGDHGNIVTPGGALRIVGHNLNPQYIDGAVSNAAVKLKNLATGAVTDVTEVVGFGDNSALEITVPARLEKGDYAVYVHSGYGNATAWSIPVGTTVGDDPRESWPDIIFNVKDYGAKGDGNTNDTPAFMSALYAAYQSGGGIVYVPKGSYHVLSTLVIPENVHLKGEDNGNTMIWWSARRWAIGEIPTAHIRILGNCEISGIYFYGTRVRSLITKEENGIGNVYIHDVRTFLVYNAGAATNGGSTPTTGELGHNELTQILIGEQGEMNVTLNIADRDASNMQLENVTMDTNSLNRPLVLNGNYFKATNITGIRNWTNFGGNYGIVEESSFRGCVGASTNGLYFARNAVEGSGGNNKELFTTDGGPRIQSKPMQYVGDDPEEMEKAGWALDSADNKVTYKIPTGKADDYINYTVSITGGQGLGQVRKIVKQNGVYIQVDSPFVVQPNRNGIITLHAARMSMQLINNTWKSGDAVGTYGAMLDGLFDGNSFADFGTQVFNTHFGPMWYVSNVNSTYTDPVYIHGDGAGITLHEDDIYSIALKLQGADPFGTMGIAFRNNSFDGYWFNITTGNYQNALEGLIIEDNVMKNIGNNKYAIDLTLEHTNYNNFIIRNNSFEVDKIYSEKVQENINVTANKKFASLKLIDSYSIGADRKGDVNLDGKVTLQDNALIRNYVAGLTELTEEQIGYADVNKDGNVDLKDAAQIRRYVEKGMPFSNASDDIEADY